MDPLSALLNLTAAEKQDRGLEHTPQEIAQQPETWRKTFTDLEARLPEVQRFLKRAGIGAASGQQPVVFPIGAGTSDYIGQSLHHLLRAQWQCEVILVASTNLLVDFAESILPDQKYLWVSFSRSGDSPEGVAVLERALVKCPNISHLLITCNAAGKMNLAVHTKRPAHKRKPRLLQPCVHRSVAVSRTSAVLITESKSTYSSGL